MNKEKNNRISIWLVLVLVSLLFLIVLAIISNAIQIGEKLAKIHPYVEIAFYVLIVIIVCVGIVYPIVRVFFSPIFSLDKLHNSDGSVRKKWCKRLVNNLLKNVELTEEEQEQVKGFLNCGDETDDKLIEFYDRKIRPELNKEILDTAKRVFLVTAVSQNSLFDMMGMAVANFNLIKRIVEICGFRPSNVQVFRLYVKVLSVTALAGSIEDLNLEDVISSLTEGVLGGVSRIVGVLADSIIQGATNALTTLRIAVITKNYLLNADVSQTRKELRKKSYAEAFAMLKDIVKQSTEDKIFDPLKKFFSRKKEDSKSSETTNDNLYWKF